MAKFNFVMPEQIARANRPSKSPEQIARANRPSKSPEQTARANRPSKSPEQIARANRPSKPLKQNAIANREPIDYQDPKFLETVKKALIEIEERKKQGIVK